MAFASDEHEDDAAEDVLRPVELDLDEVVPLSDSDHDARSPPAVKSPHGGVTLVYGVGEKRPRSVASDDDEIQRPRMREAEPIVRVHQEIMNIVPNLESEHDPTQYMSLLKSIDDLFATQGDEEPPDELFVGLAKALTAGFTRFKADASVVNFILRTWRKRTDFTYAERPVNCALLLSLCDAVLPDVSCRYWAYWLAIDTLRPSLSPNDKGASSLTARATTAFFEYIPRLLAMSAPHNGELVTRILDNSTLGGGDDRFDGHYQYRILTLLLSAPGVGGEVLPEMLQILREIEEYPLEYGTPAENLKHLRTLRAAVRGHATRGNASLIKELEDAIGVKETELQAQLNYARKKRR